MRYIVALFLMLCVSVTSAVAQVSIGIGFPGVSIGINLPVYPQLVRVPGYPVYYAPSLNSNFFFYDGMYWVYQGDNWYASSWYNGPWSLVGPQYVPLYVLRIPVRYYRAPPPYFGGWRGDAPPRWGEHWGNDWERQRSGWNKWDRHAVPAPAPLPSYQRKYSGDRYPQQVEQQHELRNQNYRYQPRDPVVRQQYQAPPAQRAPAPSQQGRAGPPQDRGSKPQDAQRSSPPPKAGRDADRPAPTQAPPQQRGPQAQDQKQQQPRQGSAQREQPAPNQQDMRQGKGAPQESKRGQGQGQGQDKDADKGEGRGKP
jgi:hypothetical protein